MAPGGAMVMPDGRSLAQWIADSEKIANVKSSHHQGKKKSKGKGKSKGQRVPKEGWGSSFAHVPASYGNAFDDDDLELEALLRVGARRRNRWFNERLLRQLAGPMDAADMKAQFSPPPFGVPATPTSFECAMQGGHTDILLNLNMDDELELCRHWEMLRMGRSVPNQHEPVDDMKRAMLAWSRVSARARQALRRSALLPVTRALDERLLNYILELDAAEHKADAAGASTSQELLLTLPDSFQRLLVHGLCDFYNLACYSYTSLDGDRVTRVHAKGDAAGGCLINITCSEFLHELCSGGMNAKPRVVLDGPSSVEEAGSSPSVDIKEACPC